MKLKTAILIFANSAEKEAERKPFFSSELFYELNRKTLKIAEKTKLPYFHFSENQQVGDSFNERFTNAIQSVFNKGFDAIITIGNDTPHLKVDHLINTLYQLEQSKLVLGPSKDGGFYLMGIKKEHFNKNVFLNLPWNSSKLLGTISKNAHYLNLETYFLEVFSDLDSSKDIHPVFNHFKEISLKIKKLLQHFVVLQKISVRECVFLIENPIQKLFLNKGSPSVI